MGINWFTVVAQVINFIILVWLLKRFLYKPVLKAIAERESRIAARVSDAEASLLAAAKEKEAFEQKNTAFSQQYNAALKQAREEVNTEKQKLLEQARKEFQTMRTGLQQSLQEEQAHFNRELRQKTMEEVFAVAGKALGDLASASLEEQAVNVFLTRLQNLAPGGQQQFTQAMAAQNGAVTIRSAFALPAAQRLQLEQAIRKWSGQQEPSFLYQVQPQLISGLELHVHNYKLSWNLEDYLDELKKHVYGSVTGPQNLSADAPV